MLSNKLKVTSKVKKSKNQIKFNLKTEKSFNKFNENSNKLINNWILVSDEKTCNVLVFIVINIGTD